MGHIGDRLEGSRSDFNDNKIDLPKIIVIKLQDKIKIRRLMNRKPLLVHLILRQRITWFTLATEVQEIV